MVYTLVIRFSWIRLVSLAAAISGESVVITFFPHPRIVLEKDNSSLYFSYYNGRKDSTSRKSKGGSSDYN